MTEIKFLGKLNNGQTPIIDITKPTIFIYYRNDNYIYSFNSTTSIEINLSLAEDYNNCLFLFSNDINVSNLNGFKKISLNNDTFNYKKVIFKRQSGYLYFALPFLFSINEITSSIISGFTQVGTSELNNNIYVLYRSNALQIVETDINCNIQIKIISESDIDNLTEHINNHNDPHRVIDYMIMQGYDINKVGMGIKEIMYKNLKVPIDDNHIAWIRNSVEDFEYYFTDEFGNDFLVNLMPDGNYWMIQDYWEYNIGHYYNDDIRHKDKYGKLYNWSEANSLAIGVKILPTLQNYINLIQSIKLPNSPDNFILEDGGIKLKSILNTMLDGDTNPNNPSWLYNNLIISLDILGLHLNPTGFYNLNTFQQIGKECRYWTITPNIVDGVDTGGKLSIRCLYNSDVIDINPSDISEYNPIRFIIDSSAVKRRIKVSNGSKEYADQETIVGEGTITDAFRIEWQ